MGWIPRRISPTCITRGAALLPIARKRDVVCYHLTVVFPRWAAAISNWSCRRGPHCQVIQITPTILNKDTEKRVFTVERTPINRMQLMAILTQFRYSPRPFVAPAVRLLPGRGARRSLALSTSLDKRHTRLHKCPPESQWLVRIHREQLNCSAADRRLPHNDGFHESKVLDPVISPRMK